MHDCLSSLVPNFMHFNQSSLHTVSIVAAQALCPFSPHCSLTAFKNISSIALFRVRIFPLIMFILISLFEECLGALCFSCSFRMSTINAVGLQVDDGMMLLCSTAIIANKALKS